MIRAYGVAQVRAAEETAMAGLPDGELMHRAATGLAAVVATRAQHRGAEQVVVLAGPGDNGGDALHAAAMLHTEAGLAVEVVAVGSQVHTSGGPAAAEAGVPVHRVGSEETVPDLVLDLLGRADLVVDGLLGIGARPGLREPMAALAEAIGDEAYVVAVDLPSGVDPEGEEPAGSPGAGSAVFADETVTFGVAKSAQLLPGTEPAVGLLTMVDIGIEEPPRAAVERLGHDDVAARWPVPAPSSDKYTRGVLGVVAGSERYPGAAVLCVSAALATGVGMVRYAGPSRPSDLVLAACPEVVPGVGRVQAWALGSGFDVTQADEEQLAVLRAALDSELPCLVDAGALDLVERPRQAPTLLTPHAGELARLLTRLEGDGASPVAAEAVTAHPVPHLRRAVELTGATVLLKGSTTLVAGPHTPVRSQADAPPWLATAGAGDVLAGVAGALLAAGLSPLEAGSLAALVHGVAADRANPGGPVRAIDVAHAIPGTVAGLLTRCH